MSFLKVEITEAVRADAEKRFTQTVKLVHDVQGANVLPAAMIKPRNRRNPESEVVPMARLAEKLGISVASARGLGRQTGGRFFDGSDGGPPAIYIWERLCNESHAETMLTLAHELGHAVLWRTERRPLKMNDEEIAVELAAFAAFPRYISREALGNFRDSPAFLGGRRGAIGIRGTAADTAKYLLKIFLTFGICGAI